MKISYNAILEFAEDGYISFSCHYKDIYSDSMINKKKLETH